MTKHLNQKYSSERCSNEKYVSQKAINPYKYGWNRDSEPAEYKSNNSACRTGRN
ncbi:hypothetical protein GCM10027424_16360 [Psychrobacter pacificensis]